MTSLDKLVAILFTAFCAMVVGLRIAEVMGGACG